MLSALQIFGDCLEVRHCGGIAGPDNSVIKAMVYVVLDQRSLGLQDGFLHGMQLLCNINARFFCLDHSDHAQQMTVCAFQPLDDPRVGCMLCLVCHIAEVSPHGG